MSVPVHASVMPWLMEPAPHSAGRQWAPRADRPTVSRARRARADEGRADVRRQPLGLPTLVAPWVSAPGGHEVHVELPAVLYVLAGQAVHVGHARGDGVQEGDQSNARWPRRPRRRTLAAAAGRAKGAGGAVWPVRARSHAPALSVGRVRTARAAGSRARTRAAVLRAVGRLAGLAGWAAAGPPRRRPTPPRSAADDQRARRRRTRAGRQAGAAARVGVAGARQARRAAGLRAKVGVRVRGAGCAREARPAECTGSASRGGHASADDRAGARRTSAAVAGAVAVAARRARCTTAPHGTGPRQVRQRDCFRIPAPCVRWGPWQADDAMLPGALTSVPAGHGVQAAKPLALLKVLLGHAAISRRTASAA